MENTEIQSTLVRLATVNKVGHFQGSVMVQQIGNELLLPPDAVELTPPTEDPFTSENFYKLSEDKKSWEVIKKPTTAAECVLFGKVSHTSEDVQDKILRNLYQKLVDQDPEHYTITRGEDLSWKVVAIPEKTEEEKAEEAKLARIAELKQNLADTDYVAAKIAEGAATKEEYADVLAQREAWRKEINELETTESSNV